MPIAFPFCTDLYEGTQWPFWGLRPVDYDGNPIGPTDYAITSVAKRRKTDLTPAKVLTIDKGDTGFAFKDNVDLRGGYHYWLDIRIVVKGSYADYVRAVLVYVERRVTAGINATGVGTTVQGAYVDWKLPIRINGETGDVEEVVDESNQNVQDENNQNVVTP